MPDLCQTSRNTDNIVLVHKRAAWRFKTPFKDIGIEKQRELNFSPP